MAANMDEETTASSSIMGSVVDSLLRRSTVKMDTCNSSQVVNPNRFVRSSPGRARQNVNDNMMSTSTWTEGESGIGSELLRSTIPPENATSMNRSQLVSISDEVVEGSRQTPRNRWAQCREMSLNKSKQRISTAQKDLDGILNIETEQRNALAAVSRILNQYSSHRASACADARHHPRRSRNTDAVNMSVYRNTASALLYPHRSHNLVLWTAKHPTYCTNCEGLLWGITRQGLKCSDCGVKCHERCRDMLSIDCLQRAASKKSSNKNDTQELKESMLQLIQCRLKTAAEELKLLANIFSLTPSESQRNLDLVKDKLLKKDLIWSAKLKVTVVEARGLMPMDKNGLSDPYCAVQVGKHHKNTTTKKETLDPKWNESFDFKVESARESIKIRIWDEDDDLRSRLKDKILREADDFLGQVVIDIRSITGDSDSWYELQPRTAKTTIKGSIRIKISMTRKTDIDGDEKLATIPNQFLILHSHILSYLQDLTGNSNSSKTSPIISCSSSGQVSVSNRIAQKILDSFTKHYGITKIFIQMATFGHLTENLNMIDAAETLWIISGHAIEHYCHEPNTAHLTMDERLYASNIQKRNLSGQVKKAEMFIRLKLNSYRMHYGKNLNEPTAHNLELSLKILIKLVEFKEKVLKENNSKLDEMILDCCSKCHEITYGNVFHEAEEYQVRASIAGSVDDGDGIWQQQGENTESSCDHSAPLEFWERFLRCVVSLVEEDMVYYSPIFTSVIPDLKLTTCSAVKFWSMLLNDLVGFLEHESDCRHWSTTSDYMKLQKLVKEVYERLSAMIDDKNFTGLAPYAEHFIPFTCIWLDDCIIEYCKYVEKSYQLDESDGFQRTNEYVKFSSSVVDLFDMLNQLGASTSKLRSDCHKFNGILENKFAQVVTTAIFHYIEIFMKDFRKYLNEANISYVMTNNIQQIREQLQDLYITMGQDQLHPKAQEYFREAQSKLSKTIDKCIRMLGVSLKPCTDSGIVAMYNELQQLSQNLAPNSANIAAAREQVFQALIPLVNEQLDHLHEHIEQKPFFKILKIVWNFLIEGILHKIILHPERIEPMENRTYLSATLKKTLIRTERPLTNFQVEVISNVIVSLEDYFHQNGEGLKKAFFNKDNSLRQLKYTLDKYTEETDVLIWRLMDSYTSTAKKMPPELIRPSIVLAFELSLIKSGRKTFSLTVKVKSVENMPLEFSKVFRPFVEVAVYGPSVEQIVHVHATKSKYNTANAIFDQEFSSTLSNDWRKSEIQFSLKDFSLIGENRSLGRHIVRLSNFKDLPQVSETAPLTKPTPFSNNENVLFHLLQKRSFDNVAKQFISLKDFSIANHTASRSTTRQQK